MRYLLFFSIIFMLSESCNMDKAKVQNNQPKTGIELMANNGFNDSASLSFVNVYNTTYFVHDSTGYFICYFYDSIFFHHDPGKDSSYLPQLSFHLNGLPSNRFSVTIHFRQVNLENLKAKFFFAKKNFNEKSDTSFVLIDSGTRQVTIDSLKADASGYYYLNVFGICQNKGLWFAVNRITVNSEDSTKR